METPKNLNSTLNNQQGTTAILAGVALLALISFAALAVDIGYVLTTKNELQNIADAAALAAARKLGDIYMAEFYNEATHRPLVAGEAIEVAQSNWAGGRNGILINGADIEIGIWLGNTFSSTNILYPPNATKITARRDSSENTPVATFFAKLFGVNDVDIQATAVAALSLHSAPVHGTYALEGRGTGTFPYFATRGNIPSLVE